MPKNKRESLIYTIMMCFCMVFWMSMYNVTMSMGHFDLETLKEGWLGFPIAYVYAMLFDWFLVSGIAKKFAFRFLLTPKSSNRKKVIAISSCMVIPMVIVMSFYGGLETCIRTGEWSRLLLVWLTNMPKNVIIALPFQLIAAGPFVRKIFRTAFPEGTVLA